MALPRIAIVGAGGLSTKRIYPNIGAAGAVLAAVCDLDENKAAANAERFGGQAVYTDMDDMLAKEALDGVIVCIGPEAHPVAAEKVMRAGLPVYTEKPPAATAVAARRMVDVSRETGMLCTTAFKKRYANCYRRAKAFIESDAFGEPHMHSMDYTASPYSSDGSPRRSFLLDFCIHGIDLVGFLFGDVDTVWVAAKGQRAFAVSLRFASGAVGTLSLTDQRTGKQPTEEVEITGSDGSFMSIRNSCTYRIFEKGRIADYYEPNFSTSAGEGGAETGHLTEIRAFIEAIAGGPRPPSHIEESYKSMVLYEAIDRAAESGAPVAIDYGLDAEPVELAASKGGTP